LLLLPTSNHDLISARLDYANSAGYYATIVIAGFMGKQLLLQEPYGFDCFP
jgi:hypothetical protein